jgi:hypothetical protein
MINQRAGTRDLSDSEFDGGHASSDDSSIEILDSSSSRVHTAVAHRAPSPPLRRNGRMNAPDLVNKLTHAFDPEAQKARDAERSQRSFQATQMLSLTQQLRDAQAANEGLRNQITIMQGHTHDVERARDRAELRLEMVEGASGRGFGANQSQFKGRSDVVRRDGKIRCEIFYRDGGACTYWMSDPSDDESAKENKDPSPPSRGRTGIHLHGELSSFGRQPSPSPSRHPLLRPDTPRPFTLLPSIGDGKEAVCAGERTPFLPEGSSSG